MTLQQKILTKKSKKGFTLIELVVVIAILAILAAIAIPMITGIIKSATDSARETDAATLNQACKTFMSSLVAGTITKESMSAASISFSSTVPLPTESTGLRARQSIANAFLIKDVCTYNGLNHIWDTIADFGYINAQDSNATIIYKATYTAGGTVNDFSNTTTLGTVYGKVI